MGFLKLIDYGSIHASIEMGISDLKLRIFSDW